MRPTPASLGRFTVCLAVAHAIPFDAEITLPATRGHPDVACELRLLARKASGEVYMR